MLDCVQGLCHQIGLLWQDPFSQLGILLNVGQYPGCICPIGIYQMGVSLLIGHPSHDLGYFTTGDRFLGATPVSGVYVKLALQTAFDLVYDLFGYQPGCGQLATHRANETRGTLQHLMLTGKSVGAPFGMKKWTQTCKGGDDVVRPNLSPGKDMGQGFQKVFYIFP